MPSGFDSVPYYKVGKCFSYSCIANEIPSSYSYVILTIYIVIKDCHIIATTVKVQYYYIIAPAANVAKQLVFALRNSSPFWARFSRIDISKDSIPLY